MIGGHYSRYFNQGAAVLYGDPRDCYHAADCATPEDAARAAELLNKAQHLNDTRRRYTAAARTIATAEALPGFAWRNVGGEVAP